MPANIYAYMDSRKLTPPSQLSDMIRDQETLVRGYVVPWILYIDEQGDVYLPDLMVSELSPQPHGTATLGVSMTHGKVRVHLTPQHHKDLFESLARHPNPPNKDLVAVDELG